MIQLSDRVEAMEESATLAMSKKSRELKAQGKDVISLSLGEPDFFTPQFIKDAAVEGMNQNFTMYTPVPGYEDLRQAIANKFQRDNGIHYDKNQIVVSTGAKQTIANVVMSLINEGDEVIIPAPYWVSYAEIVKVVGGIPVIVPTTIESDFKFTPKQFEESITGKVQTDDLFIALQPNGNGVYERRTPRFSRCIGETSRFGGAFRRDLRAHQFLWKSCFYGAV